MLLSLSFPWFVGARPHTRVALEHYTVRFGFYLIFVLLCFAGAALCAVLWIRQARKQYQEESRQNLEDLIEGTLRTHRARQTDANE